MQAVARRAGKFCRRQSRLGHVDVFARCGSPERSRHADEVPGLGRVADAMASPAAQTPCTTMSIVIFSDRDRSPPAMVVRVSSRRALKDRAYSSSTMPPTGRRWRNEAQISDHRPWRQCRSAPVRAPCGRHIPGIAGAKMNAFDHQVCGDEQIFSDPRGRMIAQSSPMPAMSCGGRRMRLPEPLDNPSSAHCKYETGGQFLAEHAAQVAVASLRLRRPAAIPAWLLQSARGRDSPSQAARSRRASPVTCAIEASASSESFTLKQRIHPARRGRRRESPG